MERKFKEAIQMIRNSINENLKKTRSPHKAMIDKNLRFYFIDEAGSRVAPGAGAELLLNLNFVCELVKHARRSQLNRNEAIFTPGTIAPLVIDAPFGDLDTTYQRVACELLLESTDQLCLLLSTSHWQPVDDAIRDRIGSEYYLQKTVPEDQGERPVDEINIEGRLFLQTVYSKNDVERTDVIEVK